MNMGKFFKGYMKWMASALKRMEVVDIKMIKLSAAAFTLMLAKLIPGLLVLDWYWYALLGVVFMMKPMMKMFEVKEAKKKK
jgi:hypothetical protein